MKQKVFLTLALISLVAGTGIYAQDKSEYSYVPNDTIGDLNVYMDDKRYLRASYKGINLFHRWGESYTPLIWGTPKPWGKKYYLIDNLEDGLWEYLSPDLPVRLTRSKDSVEYLWSQSLLQSNFTGEVQSLLLFPETEKTNFNHLQSDFKQVNILEMTKNKITVTSTLEFNSPPVPKPFHARPPSAKVIFYPVIFPGYGKNRVYWHEKKIIGKECTVINKDGSIEKVIYPDNMKPDIWLKKEPRSLIFNLEGAGKIRYNFSFSDPDVSILIYQHTGWPSTISPYTNPGIVAKITIPAKEKFKDGVYRCTMKMEVLVGNSVDENVKNDVPKELSLDDNLDLTICPAKTSGVFFAGDEIVFKAVIEGLKSSGSRKRNISLVSRIINYDNREISNLQPISLSFPADTNKEVDIMIPSSVGLGSFVLKTEIQENKKTIGFKTYRFNVIEKPYVNTSNKHLIGTMSGWFGYLNETSSYYDAALKRWAKELNLFKDMGIGILRFADGPNVTWASIEPEQGKYKKIVPSKSSVTSREAGFDLFMINFSFEGERFTPAWAKSGRKTLYDKPIHGGYDIPKDFKAFEDYCCEVAKAYKGVINIFELENEPNLVSYKDNNERKQYIQDKVDILSTAYKGIKRGNPDALVVAGTLGCTTTKDYEWLDELLTNAENKGLKVCDIMAPHYILRGGGAEPEDRFDNIVAARAVADKHKLILWNGENDGGIDNFDHIYPNPEFQKTEKKFASEISRDTLLQKMYGIDTIISCHGSGSYHTPWSADWMECESSQAGVFFGAGGFVKPFMIVKSVLSRFLDGESIFKEKIDLNFEDGWCAVYTRDKETLVAMWLRKSEGKFDVILPEGIEYVSIVGATRKVPGKQQFVVSTEPFYLVSNDGKYDDLVNAIKKGKFVPERPIDIESVKFKEDKKGFVVRIKNYTKSPVKIDKLKIEFGSSKMDFEGVEINSEPYDTIEFEPSTPVKTSIMIKVVATLGDKTIEKDELVVYPSAKANQSLGNLVAMRAKGPVVIDGDLKEWDNAVPIPLNTRDKIIYSNIKAEDLGGWKGPEDLGAVGYVMWDDENFYFACKVTDDKYVNQHTDGFKSTWDSDSIQLAFDPLMDGTPADTGYRNDDFEINFTLNQKGPVYWRRTYSTDYDKNRNILPDGQTPGAKLALKNWEKGLIYEFMIPSKELYPLEVKNDRYCKFNFIVNDDDGMGREKWIGVTGGIGERKMPGLYKKLYFTSEASEE